MTLMVDTISSRHTDVDYCTATDSMTKCHDNISVI